MHGHRRRKCHRPFARGSACAKRPIRKGQLPSRGCLGGSARQNTKRWLTAGKEKRFHKDWFALLIYTSWRRHILFIISFLAFVYSHSKPKRGHTRTTTVTMGRSLLLRTRATVRLSVPTQGGRRSRRPTKAPKAKSLASNRSMKFRNSSPRRCGAGKSAEGRRSFGK